MKQMINAYVEGRTAEAARLHQQLSPIFKGLFNCPHPVTNPVPVKYALNHLGIPVGGVRLPLVPLTEAEAAFVRNLLDNRE